MWLPDILNPTPHLRIHFMFLRQFPIPIALNYHGGFSADNRPDHQANYWQCFSGGRSGGSRWDWEKSVNPKHKSRFFDAYATDDSDEESDSQFRNAARQRIWWHDEFDAEEDDEEEKDDGFGFLEASIGFSWVSKVFQAFGWMIPAVVIYQLLGTGPNTIIMALALPLAQSAFSLAANTLFGRSNESPTPKPRRKNRPFEGAAAARARVRREKQMRTERKNEGGNYKSWVEANDVSTKNWKNNTQNFGGWDELDNQARVDKNPRVGNANESRVQEAVKKSRRTNGDSPPL